MGDQRPVHDAVLCLDAHVARDGHHVARGVVHDGHGGLDLLAVGGGFVQIAPVLIDRVHRGLHVGVVVGVDGQSAAVYLLESRLGAQALGLHQVVPDLTDDGFHVPGVLAGAVGHAVAVRVGLAAAGREVQVLRHGDVIFLLRDVAVSGGHRLAIAVQLEHLLQNQLLPLLVVLVGRPDLRLAEGILRAALGADVRLRIRVGVVLALGALPPGHLHRRPRPVQGRVVGDACQGRTLGQGQLGHVLIKILLRRRLNAVAVAAQIDQVEVQLQNIVLRVLLLQFEGRENLLNLPGDGDVIVLRQIFNELLGDGGAAEIVLHSDKHVHHGAARAVPVHAVMHPEALVLNGHHRVDQILWDILDVHPLSVLFAHQRGQLLV